MSVKQGGEGHVIRFVIREDHCGRIGGTGLETPGAGLRRAEGARLDGDDQRDGRGGGSRSGDGPDRTW